MKHFDIDALSVAIPPFKRAMDYAPQNLPPLARARLVLAAMPDGAVRVLRDTARALAELADERLEGR